jgi:RNA polymerase sigma-70 factor (ECF subfamily)
MDHEAVLSRKGLRTDRRDADIAGVLEAQLPSAYRLASWILRDPGAAEDAVADAMLRAWERRATLRDATTADAWFTRILTNVCRDLLRRRRRSATIGWSAPPDAVDPGAASSDRDEVGRGLERLTPDERILLALRHGRDLSVPAIAAQLAVPEGTVKSRLHAAHAHLRAAIEAGRRESEPS